MIISKQFRKAQKNHKCQFCGKDIERGSNHMVYFGMDSYGKPVQNRWHPDCSGHFLERFEEKTEQVNYGAPEGLRTAYAALLAITAVAAPVFAYAGLLNHSWLAAVACLMVGVVGFLYLARMARR